MAEDRPSGYSGPMPKEMFANHTFAENIIKYHNTNTGENAILDRDEMSRLKRFVTDLEGQRSGILAETGLEGMDPETFRGGEGDGEKRFQGSLVGYVVLMSSGKGRGNVVTREERERLRGWFEGGME